MSWEQSDLVSQCIITVGKCEWSGFAEQKAAVCGSFKLWVIWCLNVSHLGTEQGWKLRLVSTIEEKSPAHPGLSPDTQTSLVFDSGRDRVKLECMFLWDTHFAAVDRHCLFNALYCRRWATADPKVWRDTKGAQEQWQQTLGSGWGGSQHSRVGWELPACCSCGKPGKPTLKITAFHLLWHKSSLLHQG